ncbi:MAG: hypothetical protein QW343_01995 [Candidatus Norongarragalinales archaeon]
MHEEITRVLLLDRNRNKFFDGSFEQRHAKELASLIVSSVKIGGNALSTSEKAAKKQWRRVAKKFDSPFKEAVSAFVGLHDVLNLSYEEALSVLKSTRSKYSFEDVLALTEGIAQVFESASPAERRNAALEVFSVAADVAPQDKSLLLFSLRLLEEARAKNAPEAKMSFKRVAGYVFRGSKFLKSEEAHRFFPFVLGFTSGKRIMSLPHAVALLSLADKNRVKCSALLNLLKTSAVTSVTVFSNYAREARQRGVSFNLADYIALRHKHARLAQEFSPFARDPRAVETALEHAERHHVLAGDYFALFKKAFAREIDKGNRLHLDEFVQRTASFHPRDAACLIQQGLSPTPNEYALLKALSARIKNKDAASLLDMIRAYSQHASDAASLYRLAKAEETVPRQFVLRLLDSKVFRGGDASITPAHYQFHYKVENTASSSISFKVDHGLLHELFPKTTAPRKALAALELHRFLLPHAKQDSAAVTRVLSRRLGCGGLKKALTTSFWKRRVNDDFALSVASELMKTSGEQAADSWLSLVEKMRGQPFTRKQVKRITASESARTTRVGTSASQRSVWAFEEKNRVLAEKLRELYPDVRGVTHEQLAAVLGAFLRPNSVLTAENFRRVEDIMRLSRVKDGDVVNNALNKLRRLGLVVYGEHAQDRQTFGLNIKGLRGRATKLFAFVEKTFYEKNAGG